MGSDDGKPLRGPKQIEQAFNKLPMKAKLGVGLLAGVIGIIVLYFVIEEHDTLFIMSESCHVLGICVLIYKLSTTKTCAGLSLKSQEVTALFLAVRLYCSYIMEYDLHTLLDFLTLVTTLWVIFTIRTKLRPTYNAEADSLGHLFVVVPCLVLALIAHPTTSHFLAHRILWALCVYLEAVSVAPQLKMMQNIQLVERFTAFYVFMLGIARFLSCSHWVLQMMKENSFLRTALFSGLWPAMVLLSEIVQTFILADFCYYYVVSVAQGSDMVRLPANIV